MSVNTIDGLNMYDPNENIGGNQLTTFGLGIGLGMLFNGAPFGTIFGQMSNYNSQAYTFEFTLSDSSYPVALNRYISLIIQVTVADAIGNGGGVSSDIGSGIE